MEEEEEEAAVAIQTSLNLVEIGNVQPKFGTMEMIFVSLKNQGWNPGLSVNLMEFGIEMFGILWGWFLDIFECKEE